jgi:hypothetical protein
MRSGHLPYARDTVYGIGWESISTTATKDYTLTSTSPEATVYSDRGNRVSIYINYSGRNGHWGLVEVPTVLRVSLTTNPIDLLH